MKINVVNGILIGTAAILLSGCAHVVRRHPDDVHRIALLQKDVDRLSAELALKEKEKEAIAEKLVRERQELERSLKAEIDAKILTIEQLEKGIVITFLDRVLFDSGRATIRREARPALDKIAEILKNRFAERKIDIEGHTDNEPIRYSGWKSNWELSAARALSVLHYLVGKQAVEPERISATGFGEFAPIATNDTVEGRQKNRRVEIVILPELIKRVARE
jgi:chemotaxis protein MotB